MSKLLGQGIRDARIAKGLSQVELAQVVGVSQGAIGQWEREEFTPRGRNLIALRDALGNFDSPLSCGTLDVARARQRIQRPELLTRQNMSPELRRELEEIESNEYALLVREGLDEALSNVAYLHTTIGPKTHPHNAQDQNPFEVEFYWDDPVFGSMAKLDLRQDLLERFSDAPDVYRDVIVKTEKAMRDFADELAALLRQSPE